MTDIIRLARDILDENQELRDTLRYCRDELDECYKIIFKTDDPWDKEQLERHISENPARQTLEKLK